MSALKRFGGWLAGPTVISVLLALVIGGVFMAVAGANPIDGFVAMFQGSLGDGLGISNTLQRAIPIVGMAIAVALAFRAGVLNLGAEGQMVLGGLVGGLVALTMPGPPLLVTLCAIGAAVAAGALWGVLAALLESGLGVPILITTLLLNYPARYFASWLVRFPLKDPTSSMVASLPIDPAVQIPPLAGRNTPVGEALTDAFGKQSIPAMIGANVNWSLLVVIAVVLLVIFVNSKTRYGFESGISGQNAEFARYAGVRTNLLTARTMAFSGGLAGLFGVMLVIGAPNTRIIDGALVQTNYAWTGLLVALLAAYRPVGVVLAGTFFAAIIVGSAAIGRELGMSPQIAAIIQALVIILLAFRVRLPQALFGRWNGPPADKAEPPPLPRPDEAATATESGRL